MRFSNTTDVYMHLWIVPLQHMDINVGNMIFAGLFKLSLRYILTINVLKHVWSSTFYDKTINSYNDISVHCQSRK